MVPPGSASALGPSCLVAAAAELEPPGRRVVRVGRAAPSARRRGGCVPARPARRRAGLQQRLVERGRAPPRRSARRRAAAPRRSRRAPATAGPTGTSRRGGGHQQREGERHAAPVLLGAHHPAFARAPSCATQASQAATSSGLHARALRQLREAPAVARALGPAHLRQRHRERREVFARRRRDRRAASPCTCRRAACGRLLRPSKKRASTRRAHMPMSSPNRSAAMSPAAPGSSRPAAWLMLVERRCASAVRPPRSARAAC